MLSSRHARTRDPPRGQSRRAELAPDPVLLRGPAHRTSASRCCRRDKTERVRMLEWFQRLMPREHKFFPLFEQHAGTITAAAQALRLMLDGGEEVAQHSESI